LALCEKLPLLPQFKAAMSDVSIYLNNPGAEQQLQVFTRDGRQLLGSRVNTEYESQLFTSENGFVIWHYLQRSVFEQSR